MSLLNPKQIHEVLAAQMGTAPAALKTNPKARLEKLLEDSNLTPGEVLDNLSSMMRSSEADSVRLGAAKVALELNGLINADGAKNDFNVTINIIDNEFSVNPILVPRL